MQIVKMAITPAQATEWLKTKNTRNRKLSLSRARIYADDMQSGNWHLTHQGIAFYKDGVIADGQTRLKAIELFNQPVEMMVTFGIDESASIGIDAHRMRSTNDQICISGKAAWIGKNEVALATLLMRFSGLAQRVSTSDLVKFCDSHKVMIQFSIESLSTHIRYITTAPVRCAISLAYEYESQKRLEDFCKVLSTGVMDEHGDLAAIRLRERILTDGRNLQSSDSGRNECILLTSRAIKAFCAREQLKKLVTPKEQIYKMKIESTP